MPLEGSYMLWNNRGGTGKTILTYHIACKYAIKHPDKTVLIIDMCPQADLSHAFLGNDENKMDYVSQIGTLKKDPMVIGDQTIAKTVSGYLDLSTSTILSEKNITVDPRTFLFNVSKYNSLLPRNIYLLCGDPSIELVARSLEQKRNQHSSLSQFGPYAWKSVTCCLKQFVRKIAERKGIKLAAFIDGNSSFSILTEIGLAAADKLIIPITDDHLRRNGFDYMFALLYGYSQPSNVYFYYRHFSFYYRALEHEVKLPKIHLILNRYTTTINTNDNDAAWDFIFDLFKKHPQAFNIETSNNENKQRQSLKEFKDRFVIDISATESTNKIIRQAIRSHSPLNVKQQSLSMTSPTSSPLFGLTSALTSPSLLSTPRMSQKSRSPSPAKPRRKDQIPFISADSNSFSNKNLNNSQYPYQHQRHFTTKPNDNLSSLNNLSVNDDNDNCSENDAILFDKILDKIVCSLRD